MTSLTERNGAAEAVAPRGTRREMRPIDSATFRHSRFSRADRYRPAGRTEVRPVTDRDGVLLVRPMWHRWPESNAARVAGAPPHRRLCLPSDRAPRDRADRDAAVRASV